MSSFEFECNECGATSGPLTGDLQEELRRLVHEQWWKIVNGEDFVCFNCRVSDMIGSLEHFNVIAAAGK